MGLLAVVIWAGIFLLYVLAAFLPPVFLLIWGPFETKAVLILYFVLCYGLLFLLTRKSMQKYPKQETQPSID